MFYANIRAPSHNNLSSIFVPLYDHLPYYLLFCREDKDHLFNCSPFHLKIYLYLYCTCLHCLLFIENIPIPSECVNLTTL